LEWNNLMTSFAKNCNNSDTSEVTTSIHTHLEVLIIMLKHHEYINNKPGRVNTRVDFPINGFVPNQRFDNVETATEYNLFAAICHKESRDKTSGHYTAQCKIKDSNNHWIKYNDAGFKSNNFINKKNRTKAKVKYYPLVYILFYIKKSDDVSPEIGIQIQVSNRISQLLADDHNNEQNQDDVVSSNNQQEMLVNENVIQVNGTNICNQGVLEENVRITNADCSSDNNNVCVCVCVLDLQ
jgi:hypothetical protein